MHVGESKHRTSRCAILSLDPRLQTIDSKQAFLGHQHLFHLRSERGFYLVETMNDALKFFA
jgi:hypothetical protein